MRKLNFILLNFCRQKTATFYVKKNKTIVLLICLVIFDSLLVFVIAESVEGETKKKKIGDFILIS